MLERIDLIVPTWNNEQYLIPMLNSFLQFRQSYPFRIIVVNNGHPGIKVVIPEIKEIVFVQAPENLGWEGGLKLGLEHSDANFVGFVNDDVYLPYASDSLVRHMMAFFRDPNIGAVGPTSNCVMGFQNIWNIVPCQSYAVPFLIGFCMFIRREALEKAGGVCQDLPGGDDLDLSIRLRKCGYKLALDRCSFIFHHGFKTGERIRGGPDQEGGWNSRKMQEDVNHALIRKHGFTEWYNTIHSEATQPGLIDKDIELDIIRKNVIPGTILELGVGGKKIFPQSIGVDYYAKGDDIPLLGQKSVADVNCSVQDLDAGFGEEHPLFDNIVAQHIVEHVVDPLAVLRHWRGYLKYGGKLILAFPDEKLVESIPLNAEHKHAFTWQSMSHLLQAAGYEGISASETNNGVSVIVSAVRPTHAEWTQTTTLCGAAS